jgi:hypothetical protein
VIAPVIGRSLPLARPPAATEERRA